MSPLYFLVGSLSVYWISCTLAEQRGPFGIFDKAKFGILRLYDREWLALGMICPICVSFWVSLLLVFLLLPYEGISEYVLQVLGCSGVTMVLKGLTAESMDEK